MADKTSIIQAAQIELQKHYYATFVDRPPSIAEGGRGVVRYGCYACRIGLNTHNQYLEHLTKDVLPKIIETALGAT